MNTIKFKTNIKCGGCVATVTPFLNGDENVENWTVDLESADRILKVETSHSPEEIQQLLSVRKNSLIMRVSLGTLKEWMPCASGVFGQGVSMGISD